MKKKHIIAILIVLVVTIFNVVIAYNVQAQRSTLQIDNVAETIAEGEDGQGGFWFWGEKMNFCVLYVWEYDPARGTWERVINDFKVVNDCVRAFELDCDYEYCMQGYTRK